MAFTAPTGPVIDDPIRPRALWYWVGGGLIVATTIGAIAWFTVGLMSLDDRVNGFERVPFPEGGTITIDEAGDYVIYAEGSLTTLSAPGVAVTDPEGDEVATAFYGGSLTYDFGGRSGSALLTFTADQAGDYQIEPDTSDSSGVVSYAVGQSIGGDLVSAIVGGFAIGGLGVVIGAVVLIVTGIRRSRVKRERRPPMLTPPSSWGQAPQTWGPQQPPPQAGWGQASPPGPSQSGRSQPGWQPPPSSAPPPPPASGGSPPPPTPGRPT
jgi:hypothetical protein